VKAMTLDLVGQTLGKYCILEEIGRGGMATVYKAYQPSQRRYVALKMLPAYLKEDHEFVARFRREAETALWLNHPNIVKTYDVGAVGDTRYIAMEYIDGHTLDDELRHLGKPLDISRAVDIMSHVTSALAYAHRQGIIHRDVKPSNILLAKDGRILLSDFGIAKAIGHGTITKTGVVIGTPEYMSPEQAVAPKRVDHRTDIYSLGVLLYHLLTGRVPFKADTPQRTLLAVVREPIPSPSQWNPAIGPEIERIILRATEKDPAQRFRTVDEMMSALQAAIGLAPARPYPSQPAPTSKRRVAPGPERLPGTVLRTIRTVSGSNTTRSLVLGIVIALAVLAIVILLAIVVPRLFAP